MRSKLAAVGSLTSFLLLALSATCLAQSFRLGGTEDDNRLEQALAQRGSLNVIDIRLSELVDKLSSQFRVPIVLSPKKLEEAGVNVDSLVTRQIESATLESILRLVLDELELDFTIRNDVILVSTPEHLESPDMLEMRIYAVRDLVAVRVPGAKEGETVLEADYDSLMEVITTTVQPESWSDVGGPGAIKEFENSVSLVVSQSRAAHREIGQLLAALRKVKEVQGIASPPVPKNRSTRFADRTTASPPRPVAAGSLQSWQVPQLYAEK